MACFLLNDIILEELLYFSGCVLYVENNFDGVKPFIFHSKGDKLSPMYNTLNDAVYIEKGKSVRFYCRSNTSLYYEEDILSTDFVEGVCERGSTFQINGRRHDFKKLICEKKFNAMVRHSNIYCGRLRTLKNLNYDFDFKSVLLYTSCMINTTTTNFKPLYIRHRLFKAKANRMPQSNYFNYKKLSSMNK